MRLYKWVAVHAACLAITTVGVGLATGNPNWPLNIPCGALVGAALGLALWPFVRVVGPGRDRS